MIRIAVAAEKANFSTVWVADHAPASMWRDPFIAMAAIGQHTERVKIGVGVANPYSRYVALTGVAAATLAELCGERIILGMGAGGTLPLLPLGIEMWNKPMTAVREAVELLKQFFKGETTNYDGELVKLKNARLFSPVSVPVYVGTRGPALSRLAGEIADGIILNPPIDALDVYLDEVRKGLTDTKRSKIDVVEFVPVSVSEKGKYDQVKPTVALLIPTTPSWALEMINAVEPAREIGEMLKKDRAKAATLVPDGLAKSFAIAGNRKQCVDQIAQIASKVDELVALSFGTVQDTMSMIDVFGKEIVPSF